MIRTRTLLIAAAVAATSLLAGCKDDSKETAALPAATAAASSAATAPVTAAAPPPATAAATATTAATSAAAPPGTGSVAAKTYDCGAKDQKACPMQGWMKRVMAPASASGDGPKLEKALLYVAAHVPPGFKGWSAIAKEGADKAKEGDVEAAKVSCKQCHDAYKESYKATMRDRAF